jgi:hypothetical protein
MEGNKINCFIRVHDDGLMKITCEALDPAVTKEELYQLEYELSQAMRNLMSSMGVKYRPPRMEFDHEGKREGTPDAD